MSGWSNFSSLAKSALNTAQKQIDKALDIQEDEENDGGSALSVATELSDIKTDEKATVPVSKTVGKVLQDDFFAAFGLGSQSQTLHSADASAPQEEEDVERGEDAGPSWSTWLPSASALQENALSQLASVGGNQSKKLSLWLGAGSGKSAQSVDDDSSAPKRRRDSKPIENVVPVTEVLTVSTSESHDGWNSEPLVVPAADAESGSTSLMVGEDEDPFQSHAWIDDSVASLLTPGGVLQVGDSVHLSLDTPTIVDDEASRPVSTESGLWFNASALSSTDSDATLKASVSGSGSLISDQPTPNELSVAASSTVIPDPGPTAESPFPTDPEKQLEHQVEHLVNDLLLRVSTSLENKTDVLMVASFDRSFVRVDTNPAIETEVAGVSSTSESSPSALSSHPKESRGTSPNELLEEMETISSSDIEIISNFTGNGDTMSERSFRSQCSTSQSPIKAMQQQSSSDHRRVNSDQSRMFEIACQGTEDVDLLKRNVARLSEILESRERKVMDVSKENVQLSEENQQLRIGLERVQKQIDASKVDDLQAQFMSTCAERDTLVERVQKLEATLASMGDVRKMQKDLTEKTQQIEELMAEGDKLSKQELKHTSIIKKLREKEKETEKHLESQKTKLQAMENLKAQLKEKEEAEYKYDEIVFDLRSCVERQEKQLLKYQSELDDSKEKSGGIKASLDQCYREIADLNKQLGIKDAEIQQLNESLASTQREELHAALIEQKQEADESCRVLQRRIEDLQRALQQESDEHARKEDGFQWENKQLQRKLEMAESRQIELSDSASSATRPLIRQIESLQASFSTQQGNWERLEKSLYDRITESEQLAAQSAEKEQAASNRLLELRSKLTQVEVQLTNANSQSAKLQAEIQHTKDQHEKDSRQVDRLQSALTMEKDLHRKSIDQLQKEKDMLSSQFEYEKVQLKEKLDTQLKDVNMALDDKEKQLTILRQQLYDAQLNEPMARSSSLASTDRFRPGTPSTVTSIPDEAGTLDDWWSTDGDAFGNISEKLRAKLQQREAELQMARGDVQRLQRSRDQITDELTALSSKKVALEDKLQAFDDLRSNYQELDSKHNALLAIYGEKVEENEELRLDLEDVKTMYRQQIEDLVRLQQS